MGEKKQPPTGRFSNRKGFFFSLEELFRNPTHYVFDAARL